MTTPHTASPPATHADGVVRVTPGRDVDVVPGRPDPTLLDHPGCDICGRVDCRPVAHITWPLHYAADNYNATTDVHVGHDCIPTTLDDAHEHLAPRGHICVDVPVWSATEAAAEAGITFRQVDSWVLAGFVTATRKPTKRAGGVGDRQFDAAAVWKLRQMGRLGKVDIGPRAAHRLLTGNGPEVVEGLLAALRGVETEQVPA